MIAPDGPPGDDPDGEGAHRSAPDRGRPPGRAAALGTARTALQRTLGELTRLASEVIGVPVALVSLVEDDRQVFVGAHCLPAPWNSRGQTGLSHSFCRLVVQDDQPLVIDDARLDPRVNDNLAVTDIGVVAYAGTPLRDPGRLRFGQRLRDRRRAATAGPNPS